MLPLPPFQKELRKIKGYFGTKFKFTHLHCFCYINGSKSLLKWEKLRVEQHKKKCQLNKAEVDRNPQFRYTISGRNINIIRKKVQKDVFALIPTFYFFTQTQHANLARLRKESEDQIEKLKQESESASKTIERLQVQLQQQSDYNLLKREIQ